MSKVCKNCGSPLSDYAIFCPSCGNKVEDVAEPVKETETTSLLLKLMRFFTSIFNFIANLFKGK